jgi:hypothetical protein
MEDPPERYRISVGPQYGFAGPSRTVERRPNFTLMIEKPRSPPPLITQLMQIAHWLRRAPRPLGCLPKATRAGGFWRKIPSPKNWRTRRAKKRPRVGIDLRSRCAECGRAHEGHGLLCVRRARAREVERDAKAAQRRA